MSLAKAQMSKHISKIKGGNKSGAAAIQNKKKGAVGANNKKIGEATAKRMQEKAQKRRPKDFDEEIDSDMAEDIDEPEVDKNAKKLGKSIQDDPFFVTADAAEMERNETLEERRLRMTKQLLEELQQPTATGMQDEFFESLQTGGNKAEAEVDIFNEEEDDLLTRRLKYQILEKKGKLFYNIADSFTAGNVDEDDYQKVFLKGHKKAITALEWSMDNRSVFTASKDCSLI